MQSNLESHARLPVTIDSCEKEQIHIPGAVQSFGALVAFDTKQIVTRASENIKDLLGIAPENLIGQSISVFLGPDEIKRISNALLDPSKQALRFKLKDGRQLCSFVRYLGEESYLDLLEESDDFSDFEFIHQVVAAISTAKTQLSCAQVIADEVRRISKFDRVKIYKFDPEWNGEVIAESRREGVASYQGLHFPQSDIPQQARELYARNRVRVIADVNDPNSPILQKAGMRPIDLSFSFIRSVSPIHLQYLRNMDVASSMSISLFLEDKLWGLIACHHGKPRKFGYGEALFFRSLSDICSMHMLALQKLEQATEQQERLQFLRKAVSKLNQPDPGVFLSSETQLDDLVRATGVAICVNGEHYKKNAVPDDATLFILVEWLERGTEKVFYCDDLPSRFGENIGSYARGILAVKVPNQIRTWIMWFRIEITLEVKWAGDPYEPKTSSEFGDRLYPRTSFALWKEIKRFRSAPWTKAEVEAATEFVNLVSGSKVMSTAVPAS